MVSSRPLGVAISNTPGNGTLASGKLRLVKCSLEGQDQKNSLSLVNNRELVKVF